LKNQYTRRYGYILYRREVIDKEQLDIEGLNITVTSSVGKTVSKAKAKARAEGLEILSNATLKLKAGVNYALIGRNGTGKSS
jgi:ABC-type polysaccharide/polyol phosphate transport system ATPase subunit